jgi:hypothetical protein
MRKRTYTEQEFIDAVKNSFSIAQVLQKLNLTPAGGSYKTFYNTVKNLQLDTSHFLGQGHLKDKNHNWTPPRPLSQILVENSEHASSYTLKNRLVKEGLLTYFCEECGLNEWNGKKLSLHLDHINGDHSDNRLQNLRIMCPNCHSQTETYCKKKL